MSVLVPRRSRRVAWARKDRVTMGSRKVRYSSGTGPPPEYGSRGCVGTRARSPTHRLSKPISSTAEANPEIVPGSVNDPYWGEPRPILSMSVTCSRRLWFVLGSPCGTRIDARSTARERGAGSASGQPQRFAASRRRRSFPSYTCRAAEGFASARSALSAAPGSGGRDSTESGRGRARRTAPGGASHSASLRWSRPHRRPSPSGSRTRTARCSGLPRSRSRPSWRPINGPSSPNS